ncbi:MAG: hypothetical protein ACYCT6_08945 [bacterium]
MFKKSAKTNQAGEQVETKSKGPIQEYIEYQQDYIKHQPRRVKIFAFVFAMFALLGSAFLFNGIVKTINDIVIPKHSDAFQLPKYLTKQESAQLNQIKILSNKLKKEIIMQKK